MVSPDSPIDPIEPIRRDRPVRMLGFRRRFFRPLAHWLDTTPDWSRWIPWPKSGKRPPKGAGPGPHIDRRA